MKSRFSAIPIIGLVMAAICFTASPQVASAQSAVDTLREEVVVTALKKAVSETVQDAPLAVTAYGANQVDALKVRDIKGLSFEMPNVSLEDVGTTRGTANFSIRGLGINSSIPSIDPTVGVFVDGMYLGINSGVVFDIFDLEAIEVLRGPQGLLFGRNVTGGAVLLRTKRPSEELEVSAKVAVETGLNTYLMGSVSGPIVEDAVAVKIAVYYNNDDGWFRNQFNDESFGKAETFVVRPAVLFTPSDELDIVIRFEHGESEGDGPAAQNRGGAFVSFDRDTFGFSVDETGSYDNEWNQLVAELNWDVAFGDGVITNIFGWREYSSMTLGDIDATPVFLFHAPAQVEQDQISNEIRYAGRFFDRLDITAGFYYFTQDIEYQETRNIAFGTVNFFGGGIQDHETYGVFTQGDFDLTDDLTFTAGIRYTEEKKDVQVATLIFNTMPCDVIDRTCPFDFDDDDSWNNVTPKVGLQWRAGDDVLVYAHWTRGFRSGGYNFRNTSAVFNPGPFDEEKLDSFEIGGKADFADGRVRINGAFFFTDIKNMQREVNLADPVAGVVQIIQNTADAEIKGFEVEASVFVTDELLLTGSIGHTDGDYVDVRFDLNGDGMLDAADEALALPRLAPWTYSAGFVYDREIGNIGSLSLRFNFAHRDAAAYTDNNLGTLNAADMIDASITLRTFNESVSVSVYGKNLLDEVTEGGDTQLPATLGGGTFSPLNKGRVIGVELSATY